MSDNKKTSSETTELEKELVSAVQWGILNFPDIEDYFIRIHPLTYTVQLIYIADHVSPSEDIDDDPDFDVSMLKLMIYGHGLPGDEKWIPNYDAIHELAESYYVIL